MTVYTLDPVAGVGGDPDPLDAAGGIHGDEHLLRRGVGHLPATGCCASNRGANSLVVFAVDPQAEAQPRRLHQLRRRDPRDFTLDPTGTLVYAANRGTGNVRPFRFDSTAGSLTTTHQP